MDDEFSRQKTPTKERSCDSIPYYTVSRICFLGIANTDVDYVEHCH